AQWDRFGLEDLVELLLHNDGELAVVERRVVEPVAEPCEQRILRADLQRGERVGRRWSGRGGRGAVRRRPRPRPRRRRVLLDVCLHEVIGQSHLERLHRVVSRVSRTGASAGENRSTSCASETDAGLRGSPASTGSPWFTASGTARLLGTVTSTSR